jgi:Mu transposase, C-terminal
MTEPASGTVERRTFGRRGLRFWNIHYWSEVLPTPARLGEAMLPRHDPRDTRRLWMRRPDHNYFDVPHLNY